MATREVNVRLDVAGLPEVRAKFAAAKAVLAERERELFELKGPCSNTRCRLHYAHAGPCDSRVQA